MQTRHNEFTIECSCTGWRWRKNISRSSATRYVLSWVWVSFLVSTDQIFYKYFLGDRKAPCYNFWCGDFWILEPDMSWIVYIQGGETSPCWQGLPKRFLDWTVTTSVFPQITWKKNHVLTRLAKWNHRLKSCPKATGFSTFVTLQI